MEGILVAWYNEPYNEMVEYEIIGNAVSLDEAKEMKASWLKGDCNGWNKEYLSFHYNVRNFDGRYRVAINTGI